MLVSRFTTGLRALMARDHREAGQGLAEYALILALIAIVAVVAVTFMGQQVSTEFSNIGNAVASAAP